MKQNICMCDVCLLRNPMLFNVKCFIIYGNERVKHGMIPVSPIKSNDTNRFIQNNVYAKYQDKLFVTVVSSTIFLEHITVLQHAIIFVLPLVDYMLLMVN